MGRMDYTRRGPAAEQISMAPQDRAAERETFWRVVTEGHGVESWQRACVMYWVAVKTDEGPGQGRAGSGGTWQM